MTTTKIAAQVPEMMQASAQHLRKMASDTVSLVKRAEDAEHENRAMKLARRMELRGLNPEASYDEKVAELAALKSEKLAQMEVAVEIAAGGTRLGKIAEATNENVVTQGSEAWRDLEGFIEANAR